MITLLAFLLVLVGYIGKSKCYVMRMPSILHRNGPHLMAKRFDTITTTLPKDYEPFCKVEIGGNKEIIPGDYVSHPEYGIGKYLGVRKVLVHPLPKLQAQSISVDVIDVQYRDAMITWYVRFAKNEVFKFQSGYLAGRIELSSIIDPSSWLARKKVALEDAERMASNLIYRNCLRNTLHRPPCIANNQQYEDFLARFPYTPTTDQVACFEAVEKDMCYSTRPMDRLIAGDVGFGKTEVAMRAIYRAVISSKQVGFLAPTVVLATQHANSLKKRMPDVNVQLLLGSDPRSAQVKADVLSGKCQVVVSTHAVLQPSVKFHNLGLFVIDEEHKFGVDQKQIITALNSGIDLLTMSATPLPRTLQITDQELKDISQMNVAPEGRKPVETHLNVNDTVIAREAIEREISRGGQVYIVVPWIAHMREVMRLLDEIAPDVSVVQAHGRHKDLADRIGRFAAGEASILVSTTVIENGIDVPNANTILIYNAHLFGMSALYQLRGRVGRSKQQAYCFFFTPANKDIRVASEQRLHNLMTYTDLGSGYNLALEDRKIRGAGSLFGKEQSGNKAIGNDLQSYYLQEAYKQIKEELVLSVAHTQLDLNSEIEANWMDRERWIKMNNTLQVEIHMASEIILNAWFDQSLSKLPVTAESEEISDDDDEYEDEKEEEEVKESVDVLPPKSGKDEMLSEYMSATNTEKLIQFGETWKTQLDVAELPNTLSDLLYRTRLQTAAKAIGVHHVLATICRPEEEDDREEGGGEPTLRLELKSNEISAEKWKFLFEPLMTEEHMEIFNATHQVIDKVSQVVILFKRPFQYEMLRESNPDLVTLIEFLEVCAKHVVKLLELKLNVKSAPEENQESDEDDDENIPVNDKDNKRDVEDVTDNKLQPNLSLR